MPRPSRVPELLAALTSMGGVATADDLIAASSRAALRAGAARGLTRPLGGGWYALPGHDDPGLGTRGPARSWARWEDGPDGAEQRALRARHTMARGASAALSHRCAAAHHGWPLLVAPRHLELVVPGGRHVVSALRGHPCTMRSRHVLPDELDSGVTSPVRTVLDAARDLTVEEAYAIADGALRSGMVGSGELREAADLYRGPGTRRVRAVTAAADAGAANPFESVLRCRLSGTPLSLKTQYPITDGPFRARVDLADPVLRIVCEADSYGFHGSPQRQAADLARYAELVVRDWIVLPFGFEAVMRRGRWVREVATAAAELRRAQGVTTSVATDVAP